MRYKISATTKTYNENTTLQPEAKYGAWMCVNVGTGVANVMGFDLQPGEGLDFLSAVPTGSTWGTPIQIILQAGAAVRVTRLQALKIGE